ncbi:ras guanine nucleotide exchange factor domain-containing protein [Zopfochytrium polystomum]|nr:ras guanine nucleotide exchange factor domain-containing protein [Zopfochytrium polystomum]
MDEIGRLYDNLPPAGQHGVIELLVEKIVRSSPSFKPSRSWATPSNVPTEPSEEDDAWMKLCKTLSNLQERGTIDGATRSYNGNRTKLKTIPLRAPADIRPIVSALRQLQNSASATNLFGKLDVAKHRIGSTFTALEKHITAIVLFAPAVILRKAIKNFEVKAETKIDPSPRYIVRSSQNVEVIVEAIAKSHKSGILQAMVDPIQIQEYIDLVENLGSSLGKVTHDVNKISSCDVSSDGKDELSMTYLDLVQHCLNLTWSVVHHIQFCVNILHPMEKSINSFERRVDQWERSRRGKWDPNGVERESSEDGSSSDSSEGAVRGILHERQPSLNAQMRSNAFPHRSPQHKDDWLASTSSNSENAILAAKAQRVFPPMRSHSTPPGPVIPSVTQTSSAESWRVKMPEDVFESIKNSPGKDANGTQEIAHEDRWSRMLSEVVVPPRPGMYYVISESDDDAPCLTPPSTPVIHENQAMGDMINIQENLSIPSPSFKPDSSVLDRSNSDMPASAVTDSMFSSSVNAGAQNLHSVPGGSSSLVFASLRTVERRGSQRIPTFDSSGRRIGVLDRGKFTSDTSATDFDGNLSGRRITIRGNLLHMVEDGFDVLVMEMVSGRLQIIAGTVEKLVQRLADEAFQDLELVDCMIQMHSFFIPAVQLLQNLIARFHVRAPENPNEEEKEYFQKWKRPIQLKVLTVLTRWVRLLPEDFENDSHLREMLEVFLSEIWSSGYRTEADRVRRVATSQLCAISLRLRSCTLLAGLSDMTNSDFFRRKYYRASLAFIPVPDVSLVEPPQLQDSSPCLLFDARDVARYLTMVDQAVFCTISVFDYLTKLSGSNCTAKHYSERDEPLSRIDMFAQRSNMIRNWVALEICSTRSHNHRRRLVEKFIHVAKYCREMNNFHTCLLIVSGLLSPSVQRLRKTWEDMNAKDLSVLQSLEKYLDPSGNMRSYRRAYAAARPPSIPFFPVVMKDITFLNDGNPGTRIPDASSICEPAQATANSEVGGIGVEARSLSVDSLSNHISSAQETSPGENPPSVYPDAPTLSSNAPSIPFSPTNDSPVILINFDKYRSIVQLLARYMTAASQPYEFAPLIQPLLRGLPVYGGSAHGAGTVGGVATPSPAFHSSSPSVSSWLGKPQFPAPTAATIESGGSSGLVFAEALAITLEVRLGGAKDDRTMEAAWSWAGQVDGKDPA